MMGGWTEAQRSPESGRFKFPRWEVARLLNGGCRAAPTTDATRDGAGVAMSAPRYRGPVFCIDPCSDPCSAPERTRTSDLGIRRPLLYPPELRRQCAGQSIQPRFKIGFGDTTGLKSLPLRQKSVMV